MTKIGQRTCNQCGKFNPSFYPICNPCREKLCPHTQLHYNSNHQLICECGMASGARLKHNNFFAGTRIIFGKGKKLLPQQVEGDRVS
jgi:hypothetical protein